MASAKNLQLPACDRCTQGVMDATNSHYLGVCSCPCHTKSGLTEHRNDAGEGADRIRTGASDLSGPYPYVALSAERAS